MYAIKSDVFEFLNGKKCYVIPVYQRHYSWELNQCRCLWYDIVKMVKNNKENHFIGCFVNVTETALSTGISTYTIIDGQQRLTTIMLLMIALRDYAISHNIEDINPDEIDGELLINIYGRGDNKYKLTLTQSDDEIMKKLVDRIPLNDSKSRVLINYKYFLKCIESEEISPTEIYSSINKLRIVNINLERNLDDAQAIFESLNSTGKKLSESDLIRNYILMDLRPEEQDKIYHQLWEPMEELFEYDQQEETMDKFIRDYLTMKTSRIPRKSNVYEEFKNYKEENELTDSYKLCQDIYKFSVYYTNLYYCRSDNQQVRALYQDISDLKMEVVYPFLLKVNEDYSDGIIDSYEFQSVLKLCISYAFRRGICSIPTNSLNKTFASLRRHIDEDNYVNSLKAHFVQLTGYTRFPDDVSFINDFTTRDIYNMRQNKYILSHLENHDNKAPIIIENYTIEHIMPQNKNLSDSWKKDIGENYEEIQAKYLNTIGNLTLTAYNSEMSDSSFVDKLNIKGGFKESALRLNSYVVKQTTWNEETIKERAHELADLAVDIWQYPKIAKEDLAKYQETNTMPKYSLKDYNADTYTLHLFELLNTYILELSKDLRREFKKKYVAYKLRNNVISVELRKGSLRVYLSMPFKLVVNPAITCKDVSNKGHWGTGDVMFDLTSVDDCENAKEIIKQAYEYRASKEN